MKIIYDNGNYTAHDDSDNPILSIDIELGGDGISEICKINSYTIDKSTLTSTAELLFLCIMEKTSSIVRISSDILKEKKSFFMPLFSEDFLNTSDPVWHERSLLRYKPKTTDQTQEFIEFVKLVEDSLQTKSILIAINPDNALAIIADINSKIEQITFLHAQLIQISQDLFKKKMSRMSNFAAWASTLNNGDFNTNADDGKALMEAENTLMGHIYTVEKEMSYLKENFILLQESFKKITNGGLISNKIDVFASSVDAAIKTASTIKSELLIANAYHAELEKKFSADEAANVKKELQLTADIGMVKKELHETKERLIKQEQEINLANQAIFAKTGKQTPISEQVDELISNLSKLQGKLEDSYESLATEQSMANTFRGQAKESLELYLKETKNSKEVAELLTKKLNDIRRRIKVANQDKVKFKSEIILLDREKEAVINLRRDAFISRAIIAYLRNMEKTDTDGGEIELQAIANMLNMNIELWENRGGAYCSLFIKPASAKNDTESTKTLKLLRILKKSQAVSSSNVTYNPISKDFIERLNEDKDVLLQVPEGASSLFSSCVRAIQIANDDTIPADNSFLIIAACWLRLQTCDYLSRNDTPLSEIFGKIIDDLYKAPEENNLSAKKQEQLTLEKEGLSISNPSSATLNATLDEEEEVFIPAKKSLRKKALPVYEEEEEFTPVNVLPRPKEQPTITTVATNTATSAASGDAYSIIENGLPVSCRNIRLIDNICKIVSQHYPEISDAKIKDRSEVHSISSNSSLESEDDYAVLWDSNFDTRFAENDAAIKRFLNGNEGVVEEESNDENTYDHPIYRIARRYVDYVEHTKNHIGGPIEIQALADLNNWKINLNAFAGGIAHGKPQYSKVFEPSTSKGNATSIPLVLVNAGTSRAGFRLEGANPESGPSSIYEACKVTESDGKEIKSDVIAYLRKKIIPAPYISLSKPDDGITRYFNSYIRSGDKGYGNDGIQEFDLIPAADCQCISDAHKLRAERKVIFKNANTILDIIIKDLGAEISECAMSCAPLDMLNNLSSISRENLRLKELGFAFLEILAFAMAATSYALGELNTSADPLTYKGLQSLSLTSTAVSSFLYCLTSWAEEKRKTKSVRDNQDTLVANLPLDKIRIIRLYDGSGKAINEPYTASYTHASLIANWSSDSCGRLGFTLSDSDKEFFITKQKNAPGVYVASNTTAQRNLRSQVEPFAQTASQMMQKPVIPALMGLTLINLGLTIATIINVDEQVRMAEDATSTTLTSVSSPETAKASIAFIAMPSLIMIANAYWPRKQAEKELSNTLSAISRTYANNRGKLPKELAEMLQRLGVDAEHTKALMAAPQMESIQRSLFKAKNELREHIDLLKAEIKVYNPPENSQERQLLAMLENIEKMVDVSNMEELHRRGSESLNALKEAARVVVDFGEVEKSTQKPASNRMSGLLFSRRPSIEKTVKRISGIVGLGATVSSKPKKKGEAPERVKSAKSHRPTGE